MAELVREFWWLIFPVFGMVMALWGMAQSEGRAKSTMSMLRAYAEHGREPPAELVQLARQSMDEFGGASLGGDKDENASFWTFVVFAALTAGFGTAFAMTKGEQWAWVFLAVAVAMGVMSAGAGWVLVKDKIKP
ncbi:hypothetical protein U91I_02085 [alpha proteobacterium U9-1i]|nr:hypothetical protein U91I_02085 [alpha proteobacterium U9-1i]